MAENQDEPLEGIAREKGYSQIIVAKEDKPRFNPSMLQLESSGTRSSSSYMLARLKNAPQLPSHALLQQNTSLNTA